MIEIISSLMVNVRDRPLFKLETYLDFRFGTYNEHVFVEIFVHVG